jgi:hypothetical protein
VASLVTPARFAEIVTFVLFDGGRLVDTENPTVVAPLGTVTQAATAATAVLLLDSVTTRHGTALRRRASPFRSMHSRQSRSPDAD